MVMLTAYGSCFDMLGDILRILQQCVWVHGHDEAHGACDRHMCMHGTLCVCLCVCVCVCALEHQLTLGVFQMCGPLSMEWNVSVTLKSSNVYRKDSMCRANFLNTTTQPNH